MSSALPQAIHTARVPARLAGEPRLRQGLERWLAEADPARHGLPPEAIVLVRRLATRWRTVQASDSATRYAPLAALLAGACRGDAADGAADAVWFADEAELLAGLARDALAGLLAQRWWWRMVLPAQRGRPEDAPSQPLESLTRWLQAPALMPRALQRLGPARAEAWLAALGTAGQRQVVAALAHSYVLDADTLAWVVGGAEPRATALPLATATPSRPPAPPTDSARRLLQLCSALLADARAAADTAALARLTRPVGHRPAMSAASRVAAAAIKTTARATAWDESSARYLDAATVAATVAPPPQPATAVLPQVDGAPQPWAHPAARSAHGPQQAPHSAAAADTATPMPPLPALAPAVVLPRHLDTAHGGLLFLLNAALALGWYGDFTQPRHRGLACSPWRVLLLAGQAWTGPGWRRDPLRAWLIARSTGPREPLPAALWQQLHSRVAEALGDELPARAQLRRLLALPARLRDHGERLDACFPLARLPLAVRLAGLDRDPGWIPAAGCDVRFHFD